MAGIGITDDTFIALEIVQHWALLQVLCQKLSLHCSLKLDDVSQDNINTTVSSTSSSCSEILDEGLHFVNWR